MTLDIVFLVLYVLRKEKDKIKLLFDLSILYNLKLLTLNDR
jgi:hypothetical protein